MMRALKVVPTLLRVGFAEAIAYRAEMVIWVLATTMPFVMMVLWTTVAEAAPVIGQGGQQWGSDAFIAYFLSVFVVRQLASAWASWEINFEVRGGTLAMRLLRPMHPVLGYAMSNLAYMPQRFLISLPVVAVLLAVYGDFMTRDVALWVTWCVAMFGGWLITFFVNVTIGAVSFFLESSLRIMDVYLAAFFVFSGYMFPLDLFPPWLRAVTEWLPFRYQIALPVEVMTGKLALGDAWLMIGKQYAFAFGLCALGLFIWNRGVKRFQAFGG